MIDLRCHILDGAPCGPDSFAESIEMCHAAIADGVRTVVVTPRWEAGSDEPPIPFDECRRKMERMEGETGGIINFRLGFALQFSPDLPRLVERYGSDLALAGKRHLLVSLPSLEIPAEVDDVWAAVRASGFSVVLAHPECNAVLRREPAQLGRWISGGMTLQVDAASVAGIHGREVQRFALECLRQYQRNAVVASNMRPGTGQKSSLANARKEVAGKMGSRQARKFIRETPAALIDDAVAGRNDGRGLSSRGLTSVFRSISSLKALTGGS